MQSATLDAEIAALLTTANEAELRIAELAEAQVQNDNVKELATDLVQRHRETLTRQSTLFRRIGVDANVNAESSTGQALRKGTEQTLAWLQAQRGETFDRAYLEAQTQSQGRLFSLIDLQLLPKVQNEELRAELFRMREDTGALLRRGQELQAWNPPDED